MPRSAGAPRSRPWYPELHIARAECRSAKARCTGKPLGGSIRIALVRRERCTRRVGEPGVNLTRVSMGRFDTLYRMRRCARHRWSPCAHQHHSHSVYCLPSKGGIRPQRHWVQDVSASRSAASAWIDRVCITPLPSCASPACRPPSHSELSLQNPNQIMRGALPGGGRVVSAADDVSSI